MKHQSGSPQSWKARREAYRKRSGPVSNPGQPNYNSRRNKRLMARLNAQMAPISDEVPRDP